MDSRDSPVFRIGDEDGQAIGGANRQSEAGSVRNERVCLAQIAGAIGENHLVGMNLPDDSQVLARRPGPTVAGTKTVFQPPEVFQNFGPIDVASIQAKQPPL